jgi:hypothetical protein
MKKDGDTILSGFDYMHIDTLDYVKWWDTISEKLANKDGSDDQLSRLFKQITSRFYNNPLLKNTRVLVIMGKDEPETVIPCFQKALDSGNKNPSLVSATVMEVNALSKLYFKELIPLYEQVFESTNTNAHWLAILNLLNLMRLFPKQVGPFLKHFLKDKEDLIEDKAGNTTIFKLGKDVKLISQEFNEKFFKGDDSLQWGITLDLIDYAKKSPTNTSELFLKALQSNSDNVKWSVLLGVIELIKLYPQEFGPLLTQILCQYPATPLFNDTSRILVEMGRDQKNFDNIFKILQSAIQSNNPYLKWPALAELVMIQRMLS